MDVLNAVAAIATVVALGLAVWQYLESRRRVVTERERIALQRTRLRAAAESAALGKATADLIVQRSKEPGMTATQLGDLARVVRGQLDQLAETIEREERTIGDWGYSRPSVRSELPSAIEPAQS